MGWRRRRIHSPYATQRLVFVLLLLCRPLLLNIFWQHLSFLEPGVIFRWTLRGATNLTVVLESALSVPGCAE